MKTILVDRTASKGIAIGKAFLIEKQDLSPDKYRIFTELVSDEILKYDIALKEASSQLEVLAQKSDIFTAHIELVNDIALYEGVVSKIRTEGMNAQQALDQTAAAFCEIFDCMDDEYMKERSADIKDIRNRLMRILKGINQTIFEDIHEKVIVIAEDLAPSDTSALNLNYVLGFITELGGVTSHVCIIARNLELPALVGVQDLLASINNDDILILDSIRGEIIINPDETTIKKYEAMKLDYEAKKNELAKLSVLPATTLDGRTIKICANVGNIEDVKKALAHNIDGIGLFRSEFLYMDNSHFPTEEEQYAVYKEAAVLCSQELIIRTLDIGGDKSLPYYTFDKEDNPFLGWRAIRISLDLENVFKAQLRAILRASSYGNVKIMYPMIISMEELNKANAILEICKKELTSEGIPYNPDIKVGIMIETPAAVLCAENFAKYVDFFSIGTNDLTQYVLAVDRGNKKISAMYNSFHPAIVQSIKRIIDAAHANGIEAGMCGEFAGDENATKLLLGLGLDEFSMSASESSNIKNIIRNTSYEEAKKSAEKAVSQFTIQDVKDALSIT